MIIDILTGFPEAFHGLVNSSIVRRGLLCDAVDIWIHDLRFYSQDRHGTIDDAPFGGGPGMVLMAPPIWRALDDLQRMRDGEPQRVYLTPQGRPLEQECVEELASLSWLILLCGHYKDVDARVFERDLWREISLGDYVLSGGEAAATVLTDAIVRLLPGVIGDTNSAETDSFAQGLLDCPYYTRPEIIEGFTVPQVLLSGNHEHIRQWRNEQRRMRTKNRRPDLWARRVETNGPATNESTLDNEHESHS